MTQTTATPASPLFCSGMNRLGHPCANRVQVEGGMCGRCHTSRRSNEASASQPRTRRNDRPAPPSILSLPAPDEDWTPAAEVRRRLEHVAGNNQDLVRLVEVGARLASNSRAANSKATYRQQWRTFEKFCETVKASPEPPVDSELVCFFIAFLTLFRRVDLKTGERKREGKPLTLGFMQQAVAAIGYRHRLAGLPDPTTDPVVRTMLEGYGKQFGTDSDPVDPIGLDQLGPICLALAQPAPTALRDRVVVLLATDPDLRMNPTQIAGLTRDHVQMPDQPLDPMTLLVSRRGTSALGTVEVWPRPIEGICPVAAMTRLIEVAEDGEPLFRGGRRGKNTGKGLGPEGVVWLVNDAVRRTGVTPSTYASRVPQLEAADRLAVAQVVTAPTDQALRDRAITTALYWGCFRGEELASTLGHQIKFVDNGIEWSKPKAKNHQSGGELPRGIPTCDDPWVCAPTALREWLDRLETLRGRPVAPDDPVFPPLNRPGHYDEPMSRDSVNDIVQATAARAGIAGAFGSHSPRAGFVTDCIDRGINREWIQTYGGWKSSKSLDPYYRRTNVWSNTNPAAHLARLKD